MRKRTKRIVAVLLAVMVGIQGALADGLYSQASTENSTRQADIGDFNLIQYRADVYLKDGTVCNRNIQLMKESTFPSQVITDELDGKHNFQNTVNAWKAAHFATSPSEIANGGIDEKGYYTAIILSVFKAQSQNKSYIRDAVSDVTSDTNTIMSNMKKWVEESDNIELDKIKKNQILTTISIEEQSEIKAFLSKEFQKNHPACGDISTLTNELNTIFSAVNTLGEAVQLMSSYIEISEMSGSMKKVLQEMKQQCPDSNQALKAALGEAALASENLTGALNATIQNTAQKEVSTVLGVLLDEGWETIIKTNPYAAAFMKGAEVGTWLGDTVCEVLFSTNKTVEQYEKMKCLNEFKALLVSSMTEIGKTYQQNKITEGAENYFAAVDALYSAGNLSCIFAEDYAKILYEDAALGWIVIHEESYNEYLNSVQSIKNCYADEKESLYQNYLAELEEDYPDIYAIIMGIGEEPVVIPVESVSFRTSETTLEHSDDIFMAYAAVSPANATNKKITYSSSDDSILSVPSNGGFCTIKGNGIVTITATSDDGGHIATQKVTVNNKERTEVLDSSECGNNVKWKLYSNGTLVIYGTGEMYNYYNNYYSGYVPWYQHRDDVIKVAVDDGVTNIGRGAFSGCASLETVHLPETITDVGESAFSGCTSLETFYLPATITDIGDSAFYGCDNLSHINLPDSIVTMGEHVFSSCPKLKTAGPTEEYSIQFGWIEEIPKDAFDGCASLETINLPEIITGIGNSAFSGCDNLSHINLPDSIVTMGEHVFSSCPKLKTAGSTEEYNIHLGWKEKIPEDAFSGCTSIETINLPGTITGIGESAFSGCTSIETIHLPPTITNIGWCAFSGCDNLSYINLPDSIVTMGRNIFSRCPKLKTAGLTEEYNIYLGWKEKIPENAFSGCTSLAIVNLPNTIVNIGGSAFSGCTSLATVNLPNTIVNIGESAFSGCTSIETIHLPEIITYIGSSAFRDCTNLSYINLPDSIVTMGFYVFSRCPKLTTAGPTEEYSIQFGWKEEIPKSAFDGCASLETVKLPETISSIGESAFSGCSSLETINLPATITGIGNFAFSGCSSLSYINLPDNIVTMGHDVFSHCPKLTTAGPTEEYSIQFGWKEEIPENAFSGCTSLATVNLPNTIVNIGGSAFSGCTSIETIDLPGTITSIGDSAFSGCDNLSYVNLPDSIVTMEEQVFSSCPKLKTAGPTQEYSIQFGWKEEIPKDAFSGCASLETVKLPETITSIGGSAFSGCSSLSCINLPESIVKMAWGIFYDCPQLKTAGSTEEYSIQFDWKQEIPENAFGGCTGLETVKLPETITTMGSGVFSGCPKLKTAGPTEEHNIQFDWKEKIPENAFSYCDSLETIDFSESIIGIGKNAFYKTGLRSIELSKNILEIGEYAFAYCSNLENIYYDVVRLQEDREAEYISKYIFKGAGTEATCLSVIIGDDVTDIPDYSFYNANIKNLEIGKNVEYIGICAFWFSSCKKIYYNAKHVISYDHNDAYSYGIPGPWSYAAESDLELIFGDDVEYIPSNIFRTSAKNIFYHNHGDFSVKKITLGKNVQAINNSLNTFSDLEKVEVSKGNNYFSSEDGILYDKKKETLVCYPAGKTTVSFRIPDSVTNIGKCAFDGCSNLTDVIIPEGVLNIDEGAFCRCDGLTSITIPEGVLNIAESAFCSCDGLTSITIPKSIEKIGGYAFRDCTELKDVYYAGSEAEWEKIGGALWGLRDSVKIHYASADDPSSTKKPQATEKPKGSNQPERTKAPNTTNKPNTTKKPAQIVTENPTPTTKPEATGSSKPTAKPNVTASTKPIETPDVMESSKPSSIPDITEFPKPIGTPNITGSPTPTGTPNGIGSSRPTRQPNATTSPTPSTGAVLKDSKDKASYKVNESGKTVAFFRMEDDEATDVVVPATVTINGITYTVTEISDDAFSGCENLKSVTIDKNVISIGNKAFYKCISLKKVTIPAGVTDIGKKAFYGCRKLKSITIKTKKLKSKTVGTQAFEGIYKKAVIKVPKKQKKAYTKWLRKKGITKQMKIK